MENNLHTKELFEQAYGDRTWKFYRDILASCIKYGQPGQWVDLGAGTGLFLECAGKFGIRCIGLEGSLEGIEVAKQRCPELDMRYHLLDQRLPFEDNSISTILNNQVIEHLYPEVAAFMLKEVFRVLKKGGVLLINTPCWYDKKQRLSQTHINLYTPKRLKKELENAGFKVIHSDKSPRLIFGKTLPARYLMRILGKMIPIDFFSATSDCIAVKPE